MSFTTDEELERWPILFFDKDLLDDKAKAIWTRAALHSDIGVREQLDAVQDAMQRLFEKGYNDGHKYGYSQGWEDGKNVD